MRNLVVLLVTALAFALGYGLSDHRAKSGAENSRKLIGGLQAEVRRLNDELDWYATEWYSAKNGKR